MNKLQIIPLGGGPGTVTKNMFVYQWGQDALIVDCGIGFPEDKTSDELLLPDISYLKDQRLTLHGLLLTHGHDDHQAGLPYILPQLSSLPIFGSRLTAAFASDRLAEHRQNYKITPIKESARLTLGPFTVEPILVTHSVPDTFHFVITTPVGAIYHGSDFKFDLTPLDQRPPDFQKIVNLARSGILCLLSDSLRSERPGFSQSESTLTTAIHRELSHCPGRLLFTTMSSNIHRIQQAIDVAASHQRKVAFIGRSLERNVATAVRFGFLKLPKNTVINKKTIKRYPARRLALIVAGSQGQETSSLTRYAENDHSLLKPQPGDKVIFSADIIPGNEQLVFQVIDELAKRNVSVAYSEVNDDLHVSGHASAKELQLLMLLTSPDYLYPIGGGFRHLKRYQELAIEVGFSPHQVMLPRAGQIVEFDSTGKGNLGPTIKLKDVRVKQDG
ncbi:MAG: Beta-lactamase domain protein [Candidatus Beckwithbacteria bacterium GW2011_GWB1_47_15]|uniref:Beta-lactamase domain protein n=1 Tax=Candidatus Beckwithbacteria bacterium GW2011_GWB1_47_15 TaxID=1618371 RepID=A0A0G1RXM5_9BACT|nr:MAG: hypothetical protein UY43_C0001G1042 [Candidatus Beckwithbacteria bacterium GW2011_GWC1_49_16]AQS30721.1 hypothetical protein [uncultured bacterium]KKU35908.1 MAG: Beta-lactamase domain protein [Candidatus Beckwithbacteria bacterium GW2011_GWA1_46_30]KKU61872.1 MAG: Beta-lactamase domain protein [Candidatus Beckwithbacteria bacterium GW2011_GWB1_47_15]KKU72574.1 MAG: Beta-lactamase domain protein [Candidatus Beckwithbacteria bacterium GW2011_GWA2_47_25]KKW04259.1 MAG: Beta-lactamase do